MTPSRPNTHSSPSEVDRLLRLANPVALEDVPESRSPSGEALYDRVVELAGDRRPTRRRLGRRVVAVAVGAAAAAVAVALLPGQLAEQDKVSVIDRALAAVSTGPVVHMVVENADWNSTLVELESGQESAEPLRNEYWYDEERDRLCLRMTLGAEVLRDVHCGSLRASGPPISQPALIFASRYRAALESGKARVIRRETVGGRRAVVLRISLPPWQNAEGRVVQPGFVEEVAVDEATFKPLRFRHLPSPEVAAGPIFWWRVVSIESTDRDPKDFSPAKQRTMRSFGPTGNDRAVTRGEAATALGRTALWPGTEVGGAELERIGVATNRITWADGGVTESPYLMIRYGRQPWIWLTVGTSPEGTPRFGPADGEAVPARKVRLTFVKAHDDRSIDMWFGNVQRDGVYINMQSPRRDLIIEAARMLEPID